MNDQPLLQTELIPTGGHWGGLLFDNPTIGLPLALTWSFTIDFQSVGRDYGRSEPSLTFDWVPLEVRSWSELVGTSVRTALFGDPEEPSLYFFEHHRYDEAALDITDQSGRRIRVAVELRGDVDALGLESVAADAWLDFSGIVVAASDDQGSAEAARLLLEGFTDTSGLIATERQRGFGFISRREDPS